MDDSRVRSILEENRKRRDTLSSYYCPMTGNGSLIERVPLRFTLRNDKILYHIPKPMYDDHRELIDNLNNIGSVEMLLRKTNQSLTIESTAYFMESLNELRFQYDFEFWAYTCAKIQDKETKQVIPFIANKAQRKFLAVLEKQRLAKVPIRIILLKARQWGGTTLVQVYMAWFQLILKTHWHSAIIAQIEDQARNIRGMYTRLAKNYPVDVAKVKLIPFEGSAKTRIVMERECIIAVSSAEKPDTLRSYDFSMCHLSEVSFWTSSPMKSAEDLAQSVRATVPNIAETLIIMESTAKGVGNFFHREWIAAKEGRSAYIPVFVAFFEIERYQKKIDHPFKFVEWMLSDDYAHFMWNQGATLESIKYYFDLKKDENYDNWRMMAEYPNSDSEPFISTGARVFSPAYVELARNNCVPPELIGDIRGRSQKGEEAFENIEFIKEDRGQLFIWGLPDKELAISNRYVVIVDIGGRTVGADWSVIKVFDRYYQMDGGKPEVVACWTGHLDQDLVSWKSAQIASFYNDALLIVESNSLDTEGSEGSHFLTVLDEIVKYYHNIYTRTTPDKIRQGLPAKYGFHTDRATKPMVIDELNGALREEAYIERDLRACDQMDTYEVKPNGTYGGIEGCNDDHVIVTAIGTWACFKYMQLPRMITKQRTSYSKKIISAATI